MSQTTSKGYKQTDLGMVPADWEVVEIRDCVTSYQLGGNYRNSSNETAYPLIKMGNLNRGKVNTKKLEYAQDVASSRDRLRRGDVLFNTRNTLDLVGKIAIWNDELPIAYFNSNLMRLEFDQKKVASSRYVNLALNTRQFILSLRGVATGTTSVAAIYTRDLKKLCILLPPKEEQLLIADALSDTNALITALEKLIYKKRAIKTAAMQQLLTGKTRLPGFDKHPNGKPKGTKQTELGEIPEDWEAIALGSAAEFINGRAYGLHEWENHGTPVIRLQNLTGRGSNYYFSNLQLPPKQYCRKGDLLYMWSATFGPVIWRGEEAIFHYHIWKVECSDLTDSQFLFYILDEMTERLKRGSSSGGTMLHVTKEKMESTKIVYPSEDEQSAIANALCDMDEEIQALEQRLNKTRQIKQGMMQELLTGRTRLV